MHQPALGLGAVVALIALTASACDQGTDAPHARALRTRHPTSQEASTSHRRVEPHGSKLMIYAQHEVVPITRAGHLTWRSRTLPAHAGIPRQMGFSYRFVHAHGGGTMRLLHLPGGATQMVFHYHVTRFTPGAQLQVIDAEARLR